MNRVADYQRSSNLYWRAKALVERLNQRKAAQIVGSDVIRYQESKTAAVFDIQVPAKTKGDWEYKNARVRFDAAKVNVVDGGFRFNVCKGSPTALANRVDFKIEQQNLNFTHDSTYLKAGLGIYNYSNQPLYIKVYAYATDSGKVTIENA